MATSDIPPSHPLLGTLHAPPGTVLPAGAGLREVARPERGWRQVADVVGGTAFAVLVALICVVVVGRQFSDPTWESRIGWECVWLIAAMAASPLLPSGIRHDISWRSTLEGLLLDWPELILALWTFAMVSTYLGEVRFDAGPLGLALAVGTAEEFIFRVLLLGWLVTRVTAPTALVVSALVFGAAHLDGIAVNDFVSVVPQTAGGFLLGAIYLRTRNPLGPILAHAFWDFPLFLGAATGVLGGGSGASGGGGSEGGTLMVGAMPLTGLLTWGGIMVYGMWLIRHDIPVSGRIHPVGCSCGAHECALLRGT